jgi:hypothetical protein
MTLAARFPNPPAFERLIAHDARVGEAIDGAAAARWRHSIATERPDCGPIEWRRSTARDMSRAC